MNKKTYLKGKDAPLEDTIKRIKSILKKQKFKTKGCENLTAQDPDII